MLPAGIWHTRVAARYPVTTNSVTVAAGALNSVLSAGSATATIVELSGVSAAPSAADVRTEPRFTGTSRGTDPRPPKSGNRPGLEQVNYVVAAECPLDVEGRSPDPLASIGQIIQRGEMRFADARHVLERRINRRLHGAV